MTKTDRKIFMELLFNDNPFAEKRFRKYVYRFRYSFEGVEIELVRRYWLSRDSSDWEVRGTVKEVDE